MTKLLLIDDEAGIQHAFKKAFHPPEYDTLTARTAAGLARIAADRPDVIVLDVHLPDATGLQAFDRIKQLDVRTPVILVTGHGTTELAIEAMKRGAFDYLLKPLRYDELKELVRRAGDSGRLMQVPAVLSESAEVPGSGRRHGRPLPGRAGGVQAGGAGGRDGRHRAAAGGERHRQGAGGPRHLPARAAGGQAVPGHQLRGHPGAVAGGRAVRARAGGVSRVSRAMSA